MQGDPENHFTDLAYPAFDADTQAVLENTAKVDHRVGTHARGGHNRPGPMLDEPRGLVLRDTFHKERWRLVGLTGRLVTCAIEEVAPGGFEARVGYSADNSIAKRLVAELWQAHLFADMLREGLLDQGFTEVKEQEP